MDAFLGGADFYTFRTYGDGPVSTTHTQLAKGGPLPVLDGPYGLRDAHVIFHHEQK